jgi:hypothetical protein
MEQSANLCYTSIKSSPEMIFSEYEPHFNYILKNTRTPTYLATNHPELFYHQERLVPLSSLRESRRALSDRIGVAVKDINTIIFPRSLISPDFKVYKPIMTIEPIEPLIIPDKSKLLTMLPKLRTASKIVTEQEIFTYFAMVHKIPCLA